MGSRGIVGEDRDGTRQNVNAQTSTKYHFFLWHTPPPRVIRRRKEREREINFMTYYFSWY